MTRKSVEAERQAARKKPLPPRLPRGLRELSAAALEDESIYRGMVLRNEDLTERAAHALAFEGCLFEEVNLRGTEWIGLRLNDVQFRGCDLSGARWPEVGMNRVTFERCRMLGAHFPEARLRNVRLTGVQARLSLWYRADTGQLWADECDFAESSWLEARLGGANFGHCKLGRADLLGSVLDGADLRGSELAGMRVGLRELAGAMVEPLQLLDLAHLLGVKVVEIRES